MNFHWLIFLKKSLVGQNVVDRNGIICHLRCCSGRGGGWCVCVSGGTLGERGQDQENMDTAELGASLRLQGADAGPSGEGAAGGRPFRCPNQPLSPAPPGPAPALLP